MVADWSAVWDSFRVGGLGAAGALALGTWLAWFLNTRDFRGKDAVTTAADLPAILPLILATFVALMLAGRAQNFTWQVAAAAGLVSAVPGVARVARAEFQSVPREYEMAARSLGASGRRVFWRVVGPAAFRPILATAGRKFGELAMEYALTLLVAAPAGARIALATGPLLAAVAVMGIAIRVGANRLDRRQARI